VVSGGPRKRATLAPTPSENPEDGFELIVGTIARAGRV
jgi:hypothetical protein